jgi:hypothetical protein
MAHAIDEKDVSKCYAARLQTLCSAWTARWEPALTHSQRLMALWAAGYFSAGSGRWHIINLMDRGVSTIASYLCEGNPKLMVEALTPKLVNYAKNVELILNFAIEQHNFAEEVLIPGATASIFGDAIARTFYEYDRCVSVDDKTIKIGTPRTVIIEPCDYVGDPSAKCRRDFAFEGDVYRLPTAYARDLFAGKDKHGNQIADFIESDCKLANKFSAEEAVRSGYDFNKLALEEYSTFIDIYNRREGCIDTIQPMGHKAMIFRTVEWKGPDGGPYDVLGYRYLPGIPISHPVAWSWYDLDVTMNEVAQAARDQAESQKTVIGAEPSAKDAAEMLQKAKNMDIFLAKNIDRVRQYSFGGVDQHNYEWLAWAEREFQASGAGGNPTLGGRGPSADTLGQEQMVYSGASRVVDGFYNRYHSWMTSIIRKWSWALMENPSTYFEVLKTVKIPGLGDWSYPVYFSQADKVGEFRDLMLKVVPYSTQRRTPERSYQRLFQFLTQWILPTMQLRKGQGVDIDMEMADRKLADYGAVDSLPMWYRGIKPQQEPNADFVMQTPESSQGDDRLGASMPSRESNQEQQQARAGYGGENQPPAEGEPT